jgi:hypothetical protein
MQIVLFGALPLQLPHGRGGGCDVVVPGWARRTGWRSRGNWAGCRCSRWCSDPYARIAVAVGAFLAGMGLGGGRSGLADDERPRR